MVSAWRFRSQAQAPAQVSNRCGSLFVVSSADIRNSGDLQKLLKAYNVEQVEAIFLI